MNFTIDDIDYKVEFRHIHKASDWIELDDLVAAHVKRPQPLIHGATEALIKHRDPDTDWWRSLTAGYAFCFLGDQYDKETGRRLAVERALQYFNREQRRIAWDAYFNRSSAHNSAILKDLISRAETTLREAESAIKILSATNKSKG